MFFRIFIAILAIWGMDWSHDAQAIYMVKTCNMPRYTVVGLRLSNGSWDWLRLGWGDSRTAPDQFEPDPFSNCGGTP